MHWCLGLNFHFNMLLFKQFKSVFFSILSEIRIKETKKKKTTYSQNLQTESKICSIEFNCCLKSEISASDSEKYKE